MASSQKLYLSKNPKADLVGLTDVEAKIAEQKTCLRAYDGKIFAL